MLLGHISSYKSSFKLLKECIFDQYSSITSELAPPTTMEAMVPQPRCAPQLTQQNTEQKALLEEVISSRYDVTPVPLPLVSHATPIDPTIDEHSTELILNSYIGHAI